MPDNSNNSSSGAKPKTRFQYLLAKLAGRTDVNIQHPKSKDEELLQEVNNRLTDMQVDPGFESSIMITQKAADESVADAIRLTPSSSENASLLLVEGDQSLDVIVRGVATPTFAKDAANKAYVDGKLIVVHDNNGTLDKTFAELEAMLDTTLVLLFNGSGNGHDVFYLKSAFYEDKISEYTVKFVNLGGGGSASVYYASTESDYPAHG